MRKNINLNRICLFFLLFLGFFINTYADEAGVIRTSGLFIGNLEKAIKNAEKEDKKFVKEIMAGNKRYEDLLSPENRYILAINSIEGLLMVSGGENIPILKKKLKDIEVFASSLYTGIERIGKRKSFLGKKENDLIDKIVLIDEKIELHKEMGTEKEISISGLEIYKSILLKYQKRISNLGTLLLKEEDILKGRLSRLRKLKEKVVKNIEDKRDDALLSRNEKLFYKINFINFILEAKGLFLSTIKAVSPEYLKSGFMELKKSLDIIHFILVLIFSFIFYSIKKAGKILGENESFSDFYFSRKGYLLNLIKGVINPVIILIFIELTAKSKIYTIFPDLINLIRDWLFIIIFTRIGSDTIIIIIRDRFSPNSDFFLWWKRFFIRGVRFYAFVYFFMYWFFGPVNTILYPVRIVFETLLALGGLIFFRRFESIIPRNGKGWFFFKYCFLFIIFTGLAADVSGFRYFASYWYISWGLTLVVVCVSFVFFYFLDEIDKSFKEGFEPESKKSHGISYPLYWIASRWIYLAAGFFAVAGISWAWGRWDGFVSGVLILFNKNYKISGLNFSLAGFFYSGLFLVMVHFFVKLWKRLMFNNILEGSGLGEGVRQSVTSISVYFIWGAAILVSLNILGLSTTSLAVAFGALGVGLGFGLQNIFNNFISGLILLFERPIQVGDIVEIGGLFGVVEKINVRSTIVQTYDNSSIIIPNSELISSQVTNWSHKDKYIRRDLLIGVAYGSDTQGVRDILLSATDRVKEIGVYPAKPVVHFMDFGDSSLNFRVRFWTNLDYYVDAESNLRFEIE